MPLLAHGDWLPPVDQDLLCATRSERSDCDFASQFDLAYFSLSPRYFSSLWL